MKIQLMNINMNMNMPPVCDVCLDHNPWHIHWYRYDISYLIGYVSADPDGHIYVLIDIMDYQRPIVANYHAGKLNTPNGNTK